MTVYLKTVHGSHLYGLATPESDNDTFVVVDEKRGAKKRYAKQSIIGKEDATVVGITTFLVSCDHGTPQYLEAMFSPVAELSPGFEEYRAGFVINPWNTYQTYRRTANDFAAQGTLKAKRHGLRLLYNLKEGLLNGKFNPTLDTRTIEHITEVAQEPDPLLYYVIFRELLDFCSQLPRERHENPKLPE